MLLAILAGCTDVIKVPVDDPTAPEAILNVAGLAEGTLDVSDTEVHRDLAPDDHIVLTLFADDPDGGVRSAWLSGSITHTCSGDDGVWERWWSIDVTEHADVIPGQDAATTWTAVFELDVASYVYCLGTRELVRMDGIFIGGGANFAQGWEGTEPFTFSYVP